MRDDLRLYYDRELTYLRKSATQFAEKYPKVAQRLVLEPSKCEDPHVERMLEAFAFLAARIHLKMDDEFPEITEAMLSIVYPHLVRPIPSMSVVHFQLDTAKGKLSSGQKINRGAPLYSKDVGGAACVFRTCYETTLWPLTVTAAEVKAPSLFKPAVKTSDAPLAIRVELRCARDVTFVGLKMDKLRFYLDDGESGLADTLYELLCSKLKGIVIRDLTPGSRLAPLTLPPSALCPVGFDKSDEMLPYTGSSFAGHRLLMEFFSFPWKFFFLDLCGLEAIGQSGFKDAIEIIFLISAIEDDGRAQSLAADISPKNFRLGCSPIVNLFPKSTSIRLDQRKYEYPIVPDVRRPYSMEVFSVDKVAALNDASQEIYSFEPFYSLRHSVRKKDGEQFWLARRRPSGRPNDDRFEVSLSLIDLSTATINPNATSVGVQVTCTNGSLPSRLPFGSQGSDFEMEGLSGMQRIVALVKPTETVRPPLGKSALWRLVSHLSLNYLSLIDEGESALREILSLYDLGHTPYSKVAIQSILNISSQPHFTRLTSEQGVSFARGMRIDLRLDEDQFAGGGAFLFASVLERFFGMSASLNSYTQLKVTTPQRKESLHEWQPRAGRKVLI